MTRARIQTGPIGESNSQDFADVKVVPMEKRVGIEKEQLDPKIALLGWQQVLDRITALESTSLASGSTETGYCGGGNITDDNGIAAETYLFISFKKTCVNTPGTGNIVLSPLGYAGCNAFVEIATKYGFLLLIENSVPSGWSSYYWYGSYTVTVP